MLGVVLTEYRDIICDADRALTLLEDLVHLSLKDVL